MVEAWAGVSKSGGKHRVIGRRPNIRTDITLPSRTFDLTDGFCLCSVSTLFLSLSLFLLCTPPSHPSISREFFPDLDAISTSHLRIFTIYLGTRMCAQRILLIRFRVLLIIRALSPVNQTLPLSLSLSSGGGQS